MYYTRIVLENDASVVERHTDEWAARRSIENERRASPELFCFGQVLERTTTLEVVATCDQRGWQPS
jgi:hypothetical protein